MTPFKCALCQEAPLLGLWVAYVSFGSAPEQIPDVVLRRNPKSSPDWGFHTFVAAPPGRALWDVAVRSRAKVEVLSGRLWFLREESQLDVYFTCHFLLRRKETGTDQEA